jgi:deoxyribonuclease V
MKVRNLHAWNLTVKEAQDVQRALSRQVIRYDGFSAVQTICGVDASYKVKGNRATSVCVAMSYPGLEVIETVAANTPVTFPYTPGLFSFREIPALIPAVEKLKVKPDLIICDGHGLIHPRRFGLASHLGLLVDIPTIGCAKTKLLGEYGEPPQSRGSFEYVRHDGEIVGAVVRTMHKGTPVFVSIGHRICLESAIKYILGCTRNHRLPEPVRYAHLRAREG